MSWEALAALTPPDQLRLADGADVPHAVGTVVFCHYDMRVVTITELATHAEPDTSGQLPDGAAWWVDTTGGLFDGSRLCTLATARAKGWLR